MNGLVFTIHKKTQQARPRKVNCDIVREHCTLCVPTEIDTVGYY